MFVLHWEKVVCSTSKIKNTFFFLFSAYLWINSNCHSKSRNWNENPFCFDVIRWQFLGLCPPPNQLEDILYSIKLNSNYSMAELMDSGRVCEKETMTQTTRVWGTELRKIWPFARLKDFFPAVVTDFALLLQPSQTRGADALSIKIQKELLFVCTRSSTVLNNVPTQSVIQSKKTVNCSQGVFSSRKR